MIVKKKKSFNGNGRKVIDRKPLKSKPKKVNRRNKMIRKRRPKIVGVGKPKRRKQIRKPRRKLTFAQKTKALIRRDLKKFFR